MCSILSYLSLSRCDNRYLYGDLKCTPTVCFATGQKKQIELTGNRLYCSNIYLICIKKFINSKVQFRIRNELHCTFRAFIPCKTFVVRTIRFSKVKKRPHEFIMFGFDLCILTFNDNFRGRGERGYGVERGGGGGTMGGAGDGGIGLV